MDLSLADLLLWTLIVTHGIIFFCDYTQLWPQVDFVKRDDGTASDKYNLLPLETVYAFVTAVVFGTVAATLLMAAIGLGPIQFAALISTFIHAIWIAHMWWQWAVWDEMMHPDGSMSPTFFLATHVIFLLMSVLLYIMTPPAEPTSSSTSTSTTKKKSS